MNTNKKSTLLLIAIAIGILIGSVIGLIAGTFNLPIAVAIGVISPLTFFTVYKFSQRQLK